MNVTRSFPLIDISVRSGGDGRTVEAYAAVWNTPVRINDQQGRYIEEIGRSAFNKTIADRGDRPWPVIFNHGLTVHGTPSATDSMPIGASVEAPRADSRGLVTVSHYHNTDRAEEVLESIRSGAISAQSFSGRFVGSSPAMRSGGKYAPAADGTLTTVTRTEIAMNEYGPAVFAAYPTAAIVGVRAANGLSDEQNALMQQLLVFVAASDAAFDPIVNAIVAADGALDATQYVLSQLLSEPNPDDADADAEMDPVEGVPMAASADITSFAVRLDAALRAKVSGTSFEAASEGPSVAHPGRLIIARNNLRAALIERGIRP